MRAVSLVICAALSACSAGTGADSNRYTQAAVPADSPDSSSGDAGKGVEPVAQVELVSLSIEPEQAELVSLDPSPRTCEASFL